MKLKCSAHNRRVQVVESGNVLHRDKSATQCRTEAVKIGGKYFSPRVLLELAGTSARPGFRQGDTAQSRLWLPNVKNYDILDTLV